MSLSNTLVDVVATAVVTSLPELVTTIAAVRRGDPESLINLVSGQVSIKYGFKGPNHAPVTACSTGSHAIGDASRLIQLGDADVMVAGGAEASICEIGIAGFNACKALSARRSSSRSAGLSAATPSTRTS